MKVQNQTDENISIPVHHPDHPNLPPNWFHISKNEIVTDPVVNFLVVKEGDEKPKVEASVKLSESTLRRHKIAILESEPLPTQAPAPFAPKKGKE